MQTLVTWMDEWLDRRTGKRDARNERSRFLNHIVTWEPFVTTPLASLRPHQIDDFLSRLSSKRSEQTVRHVFRLIRQSLKDAVYRDVLERNPADQVKCPTQARTEDPWTYLQPDEISRLASSTKIPLAKRQAVMIAIYTGMRKGEMLALRWEDVILDGDCPHVVIRASNDGPSKNGRIGRTPLLPMAVDIFREMIPGSGLVWPGKDGGLRPRSYAFGWGDHNGRPGIKTRAGITRPVRFHDLRHTAAASLISGVWGEAWRIEEVKEFMRHSDIKITQRYAHLDPAGLHAKAARAIKICI